MLGSDYLYLILILFFVSAILFVFTFAGQQITIMLGNVPGFNTINPALAPLGSNTVTPLNATKSILSNYPSFDAFLPLIFIVVSLAIVASVAFIPVNATTIGITFMLLLVTTIVAFIFSNSAHAFFNSPIFGNVAASYPQLESLWANLGEYEVVFMFLYMICVAARSKLGGGGGGERPATLGF